MIGQTQPGFALRYWPDRQFPFLAPYLLVMDTELFLLIKDVVRSCPERLHQIGREIVTHAYENVTLDDLSLSQEILDAYAFLQADHNLAQRRLRADRLSKRLRWAQVCKGGVSVARAIEFALRLDNLSQKGRAAKYLLDICTSAWQAIGVGEDAPWDPPMPTWEEECEWQWQHLQSCLDKSYQDQTSSGFRTRNSLLAS